MRERVIYVESYSRIARFCALSVSLALLAGPAMAGNVVSQGSGYWTNAATWDPGVPGGADDVFVAAGHTVTNDGLDTIHISSLSVSGALTHAANDSTEANKLILDISNNCTVVSGGAIDVSYKGYAAGQGPGKNTGERGGAGHGGQGGFGHNAYTTRSATYGSVTNPVNLGSGAASQIGGGAIILTIGGALTVDGMINANGEGEPVEELTGGGSGGSVYIGTATISGSGTISANGGEGESGNAGGGGGGGRVAVHLAQGGATFASFTIANITAHGGASGTQSNGDPSAAGTVYLKTQAQTYGDLIVRNIDVNASAVTPLTNATYRFDSITTTNYGVLAPDTGAVLDLTGCTLHSDSTISNITSRILIGRSGSSITWPAAFTLAGTLSQQGTNPIAVASDLTIASGGILTHDAGSSTEANKLNLSITGSLTVDAGGAIDVYKRGYLKNTGPGKSLQRAGAGHGGEGGFGYSNQDGGTTYGSITEPVRYGSGSTVWSGGGAIILTVSGAMTNNGLITAEGAGQPPTVGGGAAGGSINIRAATLSGNGTITATGHEG